MIKTGEKKILATQCEKKQRNETYHSHAITSNIRNYRLMTTYSHSNQKKNR